MFSKIKTHGIYFNVKLPIFEFSRNRGGKNVDQCLMHPKTSTRQKNMSINWDKIKKINLNISRE
jgi:hypothetical protein